MYKLKFIKRVMQGGVTEGGRIDSPGVPKKKSFMDKFMSAWNKHKVLMSFLIFITISAFLLMIIYLVKPQLLPGFFTKSVGSASGTAASSVLETPISASTGPEPV